MPEPDDEFYDLSSPAFPQQGDIFPNIPLISLPPSKELVLVRSQGDRKPLVEPPSGPVDAIREQAANAFADDLPEYIVVSAQRGMGVLLTQTCDLVDNDHWLVCPAFTLEGTDIDPGNLFSNKYANLFGLRPHPRGYFDAAYVKLNDIRPIHRTSVDLSDRIASLRQWVQHALSDKLADMLSRRWGFAEGEEVPRTGLYRCHQCNRYLVENPPREFIAGTQFPQCENCDKIHKSAQWYEVLKHKRH